jgi:adenylate cyclase
MHFLVKLSIRTKWIAIAVILATCPIAVLALQFQRDTRRGFEEAEKRLEATVLHDLARALTSRLGSATQTTKTTGKLLTEADLKEQPKLALAGELLAGDKVLARIGVYAKDGSMMDEIVRTAPNEPTANLQVKGPNVLPEAWRTEILENNGGDGGWLREEKQLRYLHALRTDVGQTGWVLGHVDLLEIERTLRDSARVALGGEVTTGGVVLVLAPDGTTIGKVGNADATSERAAQAIRRELEPATPKGSLAARSRLQAEGRAWNGSLMRTEDLDLRLLMVREESQAFPELAKLEQLTWLTALIAIAVAVAIGVVIANRTTKPVRQLAELAGRYAKREFHASSPVVTGDELEDLGKGMESMARGLESSEAEVVKRARSQAALSRYLPDELAARLAEADTPLELGGTRQIVSVLFADVVAFTQFSDHQPPEKVVALLNELYSVLSETVFRHHGMVDKFMGDCVMALFGAHAGEQTTEKESDPVESATRALACAEDMHRFTESLRDDFLERYGFEVALAVGVATGEVIVGNLGSERRMEFTAIGDTVNTAARLESLARPGQTLMNAETASKVGADFPVSSLGRHAVRGKSEAVELFELTRDA